MKFVPILCLFFISLSGAEPPSSQSYHCKFKLGMVITLNCDWDSQSFFDLKFKCDPYIKWAKLLSFECKKSSYIYLQSNIVNISKKVETIEIVQGEIEQIYIEKSTHHEKITKFDASLNKLQQVPDSLFESMPNLQIINFSGNEIQMITSDDFVGSTQLKQVYFGKNKISILSNGVFSHLEHLVILDLHENQITTIAEELFVMNTKLQHLRLNDNPLSTVNFNRLPTWTKVDLTRKKVEELDVCNRNSTHVLDGFNNVGTDKFKNLQRLNASRNLLREIDSSFREEMPKIESIDFSYNKIILIDQDAFEDTPIRFLNLSHNKIRTLARKTFSSLQSLVTLDVSWNEIASLDLRIFSTLQKLSHVEFYHNQLTDLSISRALLCRYLDGILNEWKRTEFKLTVDGKEHPVGSAEFTQCSPSITVTELWDTVIESNGTENSGNPVILLKDSKTNQTGNSSISTTSTTTAESSTEVIPKTNVNSENTNGLIQLTPIHLGIIVVVVIILLAIFAMVIFCIVRQKRSVKTDTIEFLEVSRTQVEPLCNESLYNEPVYDDTIYSEPTGDEPFYNEPLDEPEYNDQTRMQDGSGPRCVTEYQNVVQVMASNRSVQFYGQVNKSPKNQPIGGIYANI